MKKRCDGEQIRWSDQQDEQANDQQTIPSNQPPGNQVVAERASAMTRKVTATMYKVDYNGNAEHDEQCYCQ